MCINFVSATLLNSFISSNSFLVESIGISVYNIMLSANQDFPGGSEDKASACNVETRVRSLGWEDPLEKEMSTHSSILVWRIPWTEEPGGLQSTGSQRVRHEWVTSLSLICKQKNLLLPNLNDFYFLFSSDWSG